MMCVLILYMSGAITYTLKSITNNKFFWETFHGNFILRSEYLPEACLEEVNEEVFLILLSSDLVVWIVALCLISNILPASLVGNSIFKETFFYCTTLASLPTFLFQEI